MTDEHLPAGTDALVVGGGFPEVYAAELSANAALRAEVRQRAAAGMPVVAECAGLLWLGADLDGHPQCGVLPASARMTGRLTLGYREAVAVTSSPLAAAGTTIRAHEFHRTVSEPASDATPAWRLTDGRVQGWATDRLLASYLHVHWAGLPAAAPRLLAAAQAARDAAPQVPGAAACDAPSPGPRAAACDTPSPGPRAAACDTPSPGPRAAACDTPSPGPRAAACDTPSPGPRAAACDTPSPGPRAAACDTPSPGARTAACDATRSRPLARTQPATAPPTPNPVNPAPASPAQAPPTRTPAHTSPMPPASAALAPLPNVMGGPLVTLEQHQSSNDHAACSGTGPTGTTMGVTPATRAAARDTTRSRPSAPTHPVPPTPNATSPAPTPPGQAPPTRTPDHTSPARPAPAALPNVVVVAPTSLERRGSNNHDVAGHTAETAATAASATPATQTAPDTRDARGESP